MFIIDNMKKYTNEQLQDFLTPIGLILDNYINTKHLYAHDEDGYKYHFSLSNIKMGRTPDKLQHNPFAIDNIKIYLQKNYPDYELLDTEYTTCKTKMRFICHKHEDKGIQFNTFDNILHNHHVCKYCGYELLSTKKQISDNKLIEMCAEKNVEYIGKILQDGQTYVEYVCNQHKKNDIQKMSLDHFKASKVPCRFCQISQGELRVKNFLDKHNIEYLFQHIFRDCKNIRSLEFDFYLPKLNTIIEYDGKQHFEMMKYYKDDNKNMKMFELSKKRDSIKNIYCQENNIKLIRIPYWDYENIEKILEEEIINIESSETAG